MKNLEIEEGKFCWVDLSTTDVKKARTFYGELLGWTYTEMPMTPTEKYTMIQRKDKVIGGMAHLSKEEKGVPPHWNNYIKVKDVNRMTEKAKTLGAKILAPPFDVTEAGRMSVIRDPTGPIFSLWQKKNHAGTNADPMEIGSFCWQECGTRGVTKAETFYTKLFGWKYKHSEMPEMKYGEISLETGEYPFGGIYELTKDMKDVPPHWVCYFTVDDCEKRTTQAKKLGGKTLMGPKEIPEMGLISIIEDPQGAVCGFYSKG